MKMKTRCDDYGWFAHLMNEKEVWKDANLRFRSLCRSEGMNAKSLEMSLIQDFGMDGDEVMDCYRRNCVPRQQ